VDADTASAQALAQMHRQRRRRALSLAHGQNAALVAKIRLWPRTLIVYGVYTHTGKS
jgi:hypothetical protein